MACATGIKVAPARYHFTHTGYYMIVYFSIYFIIFGLVNMFFIIISSDTRHLKPEYADRMDTLNTICVEYIAPYYSAACLLLIPTIIIWGA